MKFGTVDAYSAATFPYGKLMKTLKKEKFNRKEGKKIVNYVCSFDTETTNIVLDGKKQSFVYLWGFSFNNDFYVIGRTMEEFMEFIDNLIEFLSMFNLNIAIYCHNLSFDYMFIFNFIEEKYRDCKTFTTDKNDVVTYDIPYIQFRCSRKLTNLKLDQACKKFAVEIGKLNQDKYDLDLDYSKIRTTETELDFREQDYFIHDLQAVVCLVKKLLDLYDDNIKSIPLTATGYVRRVCRRGCLDDDRFVYAYRTLDLTPEVYDMCKDNNKGGNAHGNRYKYNQLQFGMLSGDMISAYVYEMLNKYVPMSKFIERKEMFAARLEEVKEIFDEYLNKYCCLFEVYIEHIKLHPRDNWSCVSKSWVLNHGQEDYKPEYITEDNGRIIESKCIKLVLNERDWNEITNHYDLEGVRIGLFYTAFRGRLPYQLRKIIFEYYKKKEDYSKFKHTKFDYLYQNAKSELLSIFGMMLTDIIHPTWKIDIKEKKWIKEDNSNADKYYYLHNYFKTQKRVHFTYTPWGNWIVSGCRNELEQLSLCFNTPIYHDTDCVKGKGLDKSKLVAYNARKKQINANNGYMYRGRCPGMVIIDHEYDQFIHFGAKRYMYKEAGEDNIKITVAGCYKGCADQIKDLRDINLNREKVTFTDATMTAQHNIEDIHYIEVKGVKILTASNVYLETCSYTIDHFKNHYAKAKILKPGRAY